KLVAEGVEECEECRARTLPLALCRTCGWDFFMAEPGPDETLIPWLGRRSDKTTIFLFDPPQAEIDVEEEDDPAGEEDEDLPAAAEPSDDSDDEGEEAVGVQYLDARGLRLVDPQMTGREYPLRPVRLHHGRGTRCPICRSRYGAQDVLTPVSLGNSSA